MKADQQVCDVFRSFYAVDEPCCSTLDRLQTLDETGRQSDKHSVTVVQLVEDKCSNQQLKHTYCHMAP